MTADQFSLLSKKNSDVDAEEG